MTSTARTVAETGSGSGSGHGAGTYAVVLVRQVKREQADSVTSPDAVPSSAASNCYTASANSVRITNVPIRRRSSDNRAVKSRDAVWQHSPLDLSWRIVQA